MNRSVFEPSGQHILADLYGIASELLNNPITTEQLLVASASAAGATILSSHFHTFGSDHGTEPGVTGVVLLAESHISIHTWPEFGFAAVDIFMCGDAQPQRALDMLQAALAATDSRVKTVMRGTVEQLACRV
jgi:S-adenosylmethionine decarboxylase